MRRITETLEAELPMLDASMRPDALDLLDIGKRFEARQAAIESDRNLSDAGKQSALLAARRESETATRAWRERRLGVLDRAVEDVSRSVARASARPGDDPLVAAFAKALRASEIRQEIRRAIGGAFDPVKLSEIYRQASPEIRLAMETAPGLIADEAGLPTLRPWVSPEEIQERRLAEARTNAPEAVAQLETFTAHRRTVASFADTLLRSLAVEPGPADPGEDLRVIGSDGAEVVLPAPGPVSGN